MGSHARFASLAVLLAALSCRSAEAWRQDADAEVAPLLAGNRPGLSAVEQFTIEPPAEPLRARLEAERAAGIREPLGLDLVGCLRVAAENSRQWQDQREQLFRVALALTLERWNFSVQQNGTADAVLNGTQTSTPNGTVSETEGSILSNLNLFKLLGIGTRITMDIGIDLLEDLGKGDAWDALSRLSLNITQPILRGFGPDIVREPLTQAERDLVYQSRAYERFRRTFAVDIAQSYFQTLERVDRLKNQQASYDNLVRLRERNEAMAEAGRQTDIQVDQTRQDELSAQDGLVTARRDLDASLDALKLLLGLPVDVDLQLEEAGLRSMEAWPTLQAQLPEDTAVHVGLARRLDHATALDQVVDAEREAHVAADALRMGLDLAGGANVASKRDDISNIQAKDIDWNLALGVDLPIDKIPERNAYRLTLVAVDASRRSAAESTDRITAQLRDSLRRLDAARESFEIQSGSVVLAERRVESAALNLVAGRASTRDVLDSQDSLLVAQNALAAALTDTILAGLALYRDMELLEVDELGIALPPIPTIEQLAEGEVRS